MSTRAVFLMTAVLTLGLASYAAAETAKPKIEVPDVPGDLVVPEGNEPFLVGQATGTQNYICMPAATTTGVAWKFLGPQATLFLPVHGGHSQQQITTHFLSANPEQGGTARATWQHSFDSSRVWAVADRIYDEADYVAPGAIPWLRLAKVGTETGPDGGSILAQTTFIQRVNTSGGVAPAIGCTQASNIGVMVLVPYTTDYYFYREAR
jgi:hypothetical protein